MHKTLSATQQGFNTQPPEGGWDPATKRPGLDGVSTHSHPKVAGLPWLSAAPTSHRFQHTATRRWLDFTDGKGEFGGIVSTHSHPKVAGRLCGLKKSTPMFQHTATRRWLEFRLSLVLDVVWVSTHSHPKVAGFPIDCELELEMVSTHSHPKVAGYGSDEFYSRIAVSTHSHPKVAGSPQRNITNNLQRFNTQPPEGGWLRGQAGFPTHKGFNTQPPEGGWTAFI